MTEYSFSELKKLQRDLAHLVRQLPDMDHNFSSFVGQFKEILLNIPADHVPHYVGELFLKLAVLMDILDTLEFGRLRSNYLLVIHHKHIFDGKLGSFNKHNQFEIGLKLSSCSHDGILYCLNKLKVLSSCYMRHSSLKYFYLLG
jgi:hypothetical protein